MMAARRIAQTLASPSRGFAEWLAAVLVGVYLFGCLVLYIQAGKGNWDYKIKILEALGPPVGLAVGWVFGKEVHRQAATDARRDADKGHALAGAVRMVARVASTDQTPRDDSNKATPTRSVHWDALLAEVNALYPEQTS
jgi:hypothetical protein